MVQDPSQSQSEIALHTNTSHLSHTATVNWGEGFLLGMGVVAPGGEEARRAVKEFSVEDSGVTSRRDRYTWVENEENIKKRKSPKTPKIKYFQK